MPRTFTDYTEELLEKAIENYKNEGPISGGSLNSTIGSGIAAVLSAVAAGIGSVLAATKGAPPSVVIGILAVVAVSVLALALIVRSDQQARTAVTIDVIRSIPKLIHAVHDSEAPGAAKQATAIPLTMVAPINGASLNGGDPAIPAVLKVKFKGEANASKVIAVKPSPEELYALRPGADRFAWVPADEIDEIA